MPSIHPTPPDPTSPMERLNLVAIPVRDGSTTSAYSNQQFCNCFADGAEASSMYSPPGMCFADEA